MAVISARHAKKKKSASAPRRTSLPPRHRRAPADNISFALTFVSSILSHLHIRIAAAR